MNKPQSKISRVVAALKAGEQFTAKQLASRFKVANPTAMISSLRNEGYSVYANKSTNSKGEVKTKYRLGTPSRKVVAAGYKAIALGIA